MLWGERGIGACRAGCVTEFRDECKWCESPDANTSRRNRLQEPKERADVDRLLAHPWLGALQSGGAAAEAQEAAAFAEALRAADGAKLQMRQDLEKEKEWTREEYVEAPVRSKAAAAGAAAGGAQHATVLR